jgi:spore maturation protein B
MTAWLVPLLLAGIGLYALYKKVDVFPAFLEGAERGLKTAVGILPTMVGMLTAVSMLRASGFIDLAGRALSPVLTRLGIPAECTALVLLKPVSGGGGLALGSEIIRTMGADSYAGRVAAVMLGASETSIYTISLYSGYLGLKNTRYAVPAALLADLTAFVTAAYFVRLQFGT